MALSPDGTKMVVAALDQHLVVLDPDSPSQATVYTCNAASNYETISISITQSNVAIVTGPCSLALGLTTVAITHGNLGLGLFRASADGSHVYGADIINNGGAVTAVDVSTFATQTEAFGEQFWTDVAVSPDGSQFAAILAPPWADGDFIGFFDSSLHYSFTNVYPLLSPPTGTGVVGVTYGPQGKVVAVPLGDSVELWDAAKGTLRARLMTPEELAVLVYPETSAGGQIAFDPTGQYLYAISASGLTVFKLPAPVDQIPNIPWPFPVGLVGGQQPYQGTPAARMAAMRIGEESLAPAER